MMHGKKMVVAGLAAGSVLASSEAASATMNPAASYNGVCGPGYFVIDSHSIPGATVFLTYNSSTGDDCVVTVRNTPGAPQEVDAEVSLAGAPWNIDSGNYTTYAGPVYVHAPHQCIDWGGSYQNFVWDAFSVHCG
jgi:hypothetical protein